MTFIKCNESLPPPDVFVLVVADFREDRSKFYVACRCVECDEWHINTTVWEHSSLDNKDVKEWAYIDYPEGA